jgi:hypothetical protein
MRKNGTPPGVWHGHTSMMRKAPARLAVVMRDSTDRRLAEERTAHEAAHDSLTGLPNARSSLTS